MSPKLRYRKTIIGLLCFLFLYGATLAFYSSSKREHERTDKGVTLVKYFWHDEPVVYRTYSSQKDRFLGTILPESLEQRFFPNLASDKYVLSPVHSNEFVFSSLFFYGKANRFAFHAPLMTVLEMYIGDSEQGQYEFVLPSRFGGFINTFEVSNLPRRNKFLDLRISQGKEYASFRIPNPAYGEYPIWEAEPLPTVKKNSWLSVELVEFTTAKTSSQDAVGIQIGELIFEIEENGEQTREWEPVLIEARDATGNHFQLPYGPFPIFFDYKDDGKLNVELIGALWQSESAWKIGITFEQTSGTSESVYFEFLAKPEVVYSDRE